MLPIKERVLGVALTAVVVMGCALPIETQPRPEGEECRLARVGGTVALDRNVGVGLRDRNGETHRVLWPFGFTAYRDFEGVKLVDGDGRIVAREGDEIATAGFRDDDGVAHPCGPIEIVQPGRP